MERKRTTPSKMTTNEVLGSRLQTLTTTMNRALLASKMGMQYGTDRDVYEALGYSKDLTYTDYVARYARQDIAKAIINRPIGKTWSGPLVISEAGDDQDTALEKAWVTLLADRTLQVKNRLVRLDKLSSLGEYGIMLLGLSDVTTPEEFATVVEGTPKLVYLKPYGQGSAPIAEYETDTSSPRYGLPKFYNLMFANANGSEQQTKVHFSRILHVADDLLESEILGTPVLESVYNRLYDLEKLVGGSAEMFWRGARPGYSATTQPDFQSTTQTELDLQDQLDEFEHKMRRFLIMDGVDIKALDQQISDPKNHVDIQIQMISAETGIPKRILMGSERGELSSSQDEDAWLGMIEERRESKAGELIIRPFVDRLIELKILPQPSTGEWYVEWKDLFAKGEKEKAEVGKIRATALKEYTANPNAEEIMPPEAFYEFFLGFSDENIEKIKQMVEAYEPPDGIITPEEEALERELRAEEATPQRVRTT